MILVPFASLHLETARLLDEHAPGHLRVRIDPEDVEAYWRLVAEQWHEPGDLLNVEQDVGIRAGVVESLFACREPWCGFAYRIGSQVLMCLGCTRFTAELKAAEPDLLDAVGLIDDDAGTPPRHWRRLDVRILDELRRREYRQHVHSPSVEHFHRYD